MGPYWDRKRAESDLLSENPSPGAKAFKDFVKSLETKEKFGHQKTLEEVHIISSQNYLDEESRRKALLRIYDLIDKDVRKEQKFHYDEKVISKVKMAFALADFEDQTDNFINYMNSEKVSFKFCTVGDFEGTLNDALRVPAQDFSKITRLANILTTAFSN